MFTEIKGTKNKTSKYQGLSFFFKGLNLEFLSLFVCEIIFNYFFYFLPLLTNKMNIILG